jgi:hypothetical protein
MNRRWTLADLEFAAVWQQRNDRIVVAPFGFLSTISSWDRFNSELVDARLRLSGQLGDSFESMLGVLERPDLCVEVRGLVWADDERSASLKVLVARRGDAAFLVRQTRSEDARYYHVFHIAECGITALSDTVLRELPDHVGPGALSDIVLPADDGAAVADRLDHSYRRSVVRDRSSTSVRGRASRFLAAPVTSNGVIEVVQGRSKFGPGSLTRHRLEWRDLAGDGRYVVTEGNPPTAVAVTARRFAELIDQRIIEVIKVLNDERVR